MKYRRKPTIVEAIQWFPGVIIAGVREIIQEEKLIGICITIHGQETIINPGDYVIEEPDGVHHYPCKAEIFEKTYDQI